MIRSTRTVLYIVYCYAYDINKQWFVIFFLFFFADKLARDVKFSTFEYHLAISHEVGKHRDYAQTLINIRLILRR